MVKSLLEQLNSITIDMNGHNVYAFKNIYQESIKDIEHMIDEYTINDITQMFKFYCNQCGSILHIKNINSEYKLVSMDDHSTCEYENIHQTTVNVIFNSGVINFVNYIDDIQNDFDINSLKGKIQTINYLSKYNIGYSIHGDVSIKIYSNKENTELSLYPSYKDDVDLIYLGDILCDAFCWTCYDTNDHNIIHNTDTHIQTHKIQPGKWTITTYHEWEQSKSKLIATISFK